MTWNIARHEARLAIIFLAAGLFSCSDDVTVRWEFRSVTTGNSGLRGEIHVVITDSPSEELVAFHLTITRMELIDEAGAAHRVYDSATGHRADLLSLRQRGGQRYYDLLVSKGELPQGRYLRIRLQTCDPRLLLQTGAVVEAGEIDLEGGGRIELALGSPLEVRSSRPLNVIVDFEIEKSLSSSATPGGRKLWNFRPIVLVDQFHGPLSDRVATPLFLSGHIRDLEPAEGHFILQLSAGRGDLDIFLDLQAEIFDRHQALAGWEDLQSGEVVSVLGQFDEAGGLAAHLVVLSGD